MPAIASAPPEGISTVVSARRVLIAGMVSVLVRRAPSWIEIFVREFGHLGQHLQADAALGQHDRREVEADAEFLELNLRAGRRAVVGSQV